MTADGGRGVAGELRALVVRAGRRYRASPRRTVVLGALAVVVTGVGVAHWLPIDRPSPHAAQSRLVTPAPAAPRLAKPAGGPTPDRAAVATVARRFAVGWATASAAVIGATATAPLAARLRLPPASPSTRSDAVVVTGVTIEQVTAGRSALVLVTLGIGGTTRHEGLALSLALTLTRSAKGWRVAGTGRS